MGHSDKAHGKQGLRRRRGGPVPPGLVSRRGLCRPELVCDRVLESGGGLTVVPRNPRAQASPERQGD